MAKVEAKAKTEKKAEAPEFKYGIDDVANGLGIKQASARVQLRNNKIEKAGKSYGWNTKAEVEEVIKKLKGDSGKKVDKESAKTPVKKVKKEAA